MSITNLQEAYRFILYFPIPIVAAIGFLFVGKRAFSYLRHHAFHLSTKLLFSSKWLSSTKCFHGFRLVVSITKLNAFMVFVLLSLLLISGALARINSSSYFAPYTLPSEELEALRWIGDQYGAQNTIFIMKPPGWLNNESLPHYWQWAAYTLLPEIRNISIYVGNLADLFSGKPSQQLSAIMERPSYSEGVLSEYSVLLVDSHHVGTFYYRDLVEESILDEVYPSVYKVKFLSLQEIKYWNMTWNTFAKTGRIVPKESAFVSSFDSEWVPHHGLLVTNGTVANLTLEDSHTSMWIIKSGLSINSSRFPFMEIDADPHGGSIAIDFYDSTGDVIGRYWRFPSWNGSKIFYLNINDIVSGKTISQMAVNFLGDNETSSCSIYSLKIFSL